MLRRLQGRLRRNSQLALVYALALALFAIASLSVSGFGSGKSIDNILLAATILALAAAGQTLVILTGGIDLSLPWMIAASALLTASLTHGDNSALPWVIPVVLGFAVLVGLMNGCGITVLQVPPIVMTLAMNVMLNGFVALKVPSGADSTAPPLIESLAFGQILGIRTPLLILAVSGVVMTLMLTFQPFGRRLYAVGTNERASRYAGVNVSLILIRAYVLSAVFGAVAGLVLLGFTGQAFNGMGDEYQFATIAAVIVGGASILGGRGHYLGTIGGAILLTVLTSLLQVFSLGAGALKIFYGVVILVSVWLSQIDLEVLARYWRALGQRDVAR